MGDWQCCIHFRLFSGVGAKAATFSLDRAAADVRKLERYLSRVCFFRCKTSFGCIAAEPVKLSKAVLRLPGPFRVEDFFREAV